MKELFVTVACLAGFALLAVIIWGIITIIDLIDNKRADKEREQFKRSYPTIAELQIRCHEAEDARAHDWNTNCAPLATRIGTQRELLPTRTNSERVELSEKIDKLEKEFAEKEKVNDEFKEEERRVWNLLQNEIAKVTDAKTIKYLTERGWIRE